MEIYIYESKHEDLYLGIKTWRSMFILIIADTILPYVGGCEAYNRHVFMPLICLDQLHQGK